MIKKFCNHPFSCLIHVIKLVKKQNHQCAKHIFFTFVEREIEEEKKTREMLQFFCKMKKKRILQHKFPIGKLSVPCFDHEFLLYEKQRPLFLRSFVTKRINAKTQFSLIFVQILVF